MDGCKLATASVVDKRRRLKRYGHSAEVGKRARQRRRDVAAIVEAVQQPTAADGQGPAEPPLVILVRRRQRLDADIAAEIARLRVAGVSWTVISVALGVSR